MSSETTMAAELKQLPDEVYRRYGFTPAKVEPAPPSRHERCQLVCLSWDYKSELLLQASSCKGSLS